MSTKEATYTFAWIVFELVHLVDASFDFSGECDLACSGAGLSEVHVREICRAVLLLMTDFRSDQLCSNVILPSDVYRSVGFSCSGRLVLLNRRWSEHFAVIQLLLCRCLILVNWGVIGNIEGRPASLRSHRSVGHCFIYRACHDVCIELVTSESESGLLLLNVYVLRDHYSLRTWRVLFW